LRYKEHFIDGESDCTVVCNSIQGIERAKKQLHQDRLILSKFIQKNPAWEKSFIPVHTPNAPPIIELMENAAAICNVGPMAAVAGALADRMQEYMFQDPQIQLGVIENGGEIIIRSNEEIIIGLYVLTNILKTNIGFRYAANSPPIGIGTSSGTFGHAFSFGKADIVTIFAANAALADAAATRICNEVKGEDPDKVILSAIEVADQISEIEGLIISYEGKVGTRGKIPELVKIKGNEAEFLQNKFKMD
jgi:ApbE superfamily uncharacterized protein (UPF0280 family)